MKQKRPALLVRVWAELGRGHITEEPELRSDVKGERLHGVKMGRHIWVNPVWSTVDTVVHELLHRLHPEWSERYVRNRTAFLINRMTDDEALAFFEEYEKRAKKRRRRDGKARGTPEAAQGSVHSGTGREVSEGTAGARREYLGEGGDVGSRD